MNASKMAQNAEQLQVLLDKLKQATEEAQSFIAANSGSSEVPEGEAISEEAAKELMPEGEEIATEDTEDPLPEEGATEEEAVQGDLLEDAMPKISKKKIGANSKKKANWSEYGI